MNEDTATVIAEALGADQALLECSLKLGLQGTIYIKERKGFRWTLEYDQDARYPDVGKSMIKLERLLQERTGRPIDLRLEAKEDKNKRVERTGRA